MPDDPPAPAGALTVSPHEAEQVARANDSGKQPVVFVHGLWLLASSWDRWAELFEEAGYVAVTARWPDDPDTVAEADGAPRGLRPQERRPDRRPHRAGHRRPRAQARGHRALVRRPADPDHRRPRPGGRLGRHRSGTVPRSAAAALQRPQVGGARARQPAQPAPRRAADLRPVPLRIRQRGRARRRPRSCYETYSVPGSGVPIFQAAAANLNPWTEAKVDTDNPDRGPLLIVVGRPGPHRPARDRFRELQAVQGQPRRHRVRRDPRPRPLAHDRRRLARGRRDGPGLREALRVSCLSPACQVRPARAGCG